MLEALMIAEVRAWAAAAAAGSTNQGYARTIDINGIGAHGVHVKLQALCKSRRMALCVSVGPRWPMASQIRLLDMTAAPLSRTLRNIAGVGTNTGSLGDGGNATSAVVPSPSGLAVAFNGDIFFSTQDGDNIRKFKPGEIVTRVANRLSIDGHSGDEVQPALDSRLNLLSGMCMAFSPDQKYLYVTDMGNRRLRRIYCPNNP